MELLGLSKAPHETRVVVAMSGGVDSSTVAALLHEKGYQVIGITLQLYDQGLTLERKGACCAGKDIYDAQMVADKLGIPHYVLNYETLFKEAVMEDFADSYLRGETPIPCVKCNQTVKFRDLLRFAKELGADALATGHYVQRKIGRDTVELHRAIDPRKDQSYFLFATTKEQLLFTHFPLGGMSKEETRQHAVRLGLEVADKPDSQDICFVPNGSYTSVIERLRPQAFEPGEIVNLQGEVLGTHKGIAFFTLGQRRGIGVATGEPIYVVKIDPVTNQVVVGPEDALNKQQFTVHSLNWLAEEALLDQPLEVNVRLRSSHPGAIATIQKDEQGIVSVTLNQSERAITPGQACVMYDGDRVLGGGWIARFA